MENFVKHYNWRFFDPETGENRGGRIAVRVSYDRLTIRQLAGCAPPFDLLTRLFGNPAADMAPVEPVLPEVWGRAMELHATRTSRWCCQLSTGMSGRVDALLRIERDVALADYPIVARLHVSMEDRLNEGVELWLGDLPPLFDRLSYNASSKLANEFYIEEATMFRPPSTRENPFDGWQSGGVLPHSNPPGAETPVIDIINRAVAESEAATA